MPYTNRQVQILSARIAEIGKKELSLGNTKVVWFEIESPLAGGPAVYDLKRNFDVLFAICKDPEWSCRVPGKHFLAAMLLEANKKCDFKLIDTGDPEISAIKFGNRLKMMLQYVRCLKRRSDRSRDSYVQALKTCLTINSAMARKDRQTISTTICDSDTTSAKLVEERSAAMAMESGSDGDERSSCSFIDLDYAAYSQVIDLIHDSDLDDDEFEGLDDIEEDLPDTLLYEENPNADNLLPVCYLDQDTLAASLRGKAKPKAKKKVSHKIYSDK